MKLFTMVVDALTQWELISHFSGYLEKVFYKELVTYKK